MGGTERPVLNIYTTTCKTDNEKKDAKYHREHSSVLCEDLEEGDVGSERLKRQGTYVYLELIQVVVQQKSTQHCKAVILQLKINLKQNITEDEMLGWHHRLNDMSLSKL